MKKSEKLNMLCRLAVELGAEEAKILTTDKIIVRNWVVWKCRFGCEYYGKSLSCPPFTPTPEETRKLLREYNYALIFRVKAPEEIGRITIELEREAFLQGYYSAFAFSGGRCRLCKKCNVERGVCLKPREMRPSMESCGIDVFATAKNAGFEINVLRSADTNYYKIGLLLIE
ncbi:DUF2284 domain-containing protein [Candidatus Bathyarchaeota archaeon]|nr:DUF2284 domain-containing protein [Candidatus Bathyarchaeota archaeon]